MATSDPSTSSRDLLRSGPVPANPFVFNIGDTKILVTYQGKQIEVLVSSHALCMASPVWRKFVYPPWQPNPLPLSGQTTTTTAAVQSPAPKVIDCREDDAAALMVLLDIVHLNFARVPNAPRIFELAQIAQLCEQYQCVKITGPWRKLWWSCTRGEPSELAGIYWTFGWETDFRELVDVLLWKAGLSDEGEPLDGSKTPMKGFMPPGLLETMYPVSANLVAESILQCRQTCIERTLTTICSRISEYDHSTKDFHCTVVENRVAKATAKANVIATKVPMDSDDILESLRCDLVTHGGLVQELKRAGFLPLNSSIHFKKSLLDIEDELCQLNVPDLYHLIGDYGGDVDMGHRHCSEREVHKITALIQEIRCSQSPVLDSHIEHIKSQRESFGQVDEG